MKLLTAVLAGAALIAAPMTFALPASAQAVTSTTTTHAYHYYGYGYGYAHHHHAAYRAPCAHGYGCDTAYLSGASAETGQAVEMDYQAPISRQFNASGDVYIDCACTHRH
jgi:hypothetical protein